MPVVFKEICLPQKSPISPSKDVSQCTAVEMKVVVVFELLNVLSQEGGPIVRWNDDGTIHLAEQH